MKIRRLKALYDERVGNVLAIPSEKVIDRIRGCDGNMERVQGAGVVGETPVLAHGQSFEYTSFCPLRTSMGYMQGGYTMKLPNGETFRAEIEPFTLAVPGVVN